MHASAAPISRQFPASAPTTNVTAPLPRSPSSPITRRKSPSSQIYSAAPPVHVAVPSRPIAPSLSIVRVLVTVAIAIAFAIGVFLLIRPS